MGGKQSIADLPEDLDIIPESNRVESLKLQFETVKILGSGTTSRVKSVRHNETGEEYAMKQMHRKDPDNQKLFVRECRLLQTITHTNIVKYCDCYIDRKHFFILTQLYTGGHLLKRIKAMEHFTEMLASNVMKQVLRGVSFLHEHNIAHRDIKPENIVFSDPSEFSRLVLIDLGSATDIVEGDEYVEWVGSPAFMAPETLRPRSGAEVKASDVWSVGVVCYQLLTGKYPFWGSNLEQIFRQIAQKELVFPQEPALTPEAIAFMRSMLHRGLSRRVSAATACADPWLSAFGRQFSRPLSHWSEMSSNHVLDLSAQSQDLEAAFKKQTSAGMFSMTLEEIGENKSDDEADPYLDLFNKELTPEPTPPPRSPSPGSPGSQSGFRNEMYRRGISVGFEDVKSDDEDDDENFTRAAVWPSAIAEEDLLRQAFEALDTNKNGNVRLDDLKDAMEEFLERDIAFEEAEIFLDRIATRRDGKIEYSEFVAGMNALAEKKVIEIASLSVKDMFA